MNLRNPCEHGLYDPHIMPAGLYGFGPSSCPGGEYLSDDALILEKVDGRWPVEAIGAMAGTYYGLIEQGGLLADIFVAQLDALSDV